MGTLVLDIETASPFEEPPEGSNDTEYYEWIAVALAYAESLDDAPEVDVLFRRGGWEDESAADLFERTLEWCDRRDVERLLMYNGTWFDATHLLHWAGELDGRTGSDFRPRVERLFERHVDVALAAADAYAAELWDDQHVLPDWKAYDLAGIDDADVWYDDYRLPEGYLSGIDGPSVQGRHVGRVLGARYVENVVAGVEETSVHRELTRLLTDYCESDVADLVDLYVELGGPALDDRYRRTAADVV